MRSFVIIAALLLGVAACSHEKQLPVREAYWAADLANSKGDLEDRAQLAIWLETRNVSYDVAGAGSLRKDFRIPLERVAGDGIVCAYWVIELIGTTADDGAIQDLEISKQGTCL